MQNDQFTDQCPSRRFAVSLVNEQCAHAVNEQQLIDAARLVLQESDFTSATISLAVVDDPTIHDLNRRFLNHDYATDVLSFPLIEDAGHLEGEVVLSADTAAVEAAEGGWSAAAEQLLYVIHGTLHLIGYRDKTPEEERAIRAAEARHLRHFGIDFPHHSRSSEADAPSIHTAGWEGGQASS